MTDLARRIESTLWRHRIGVLWVAFVVFVITLFYRVATEERLDTFRAFGPVRSWFVDMLGAKTLVMKLAPGSDDLRRLTMP